MIKKIYNSLIFLTTFSLLWQTKLIIRPAEINYWEISLFLPMIFLLLFLAFYYKYLLLNFKNKNFLTLGLIALGFLELFIIISIFLSPDYLLSLYRYFIFLLALLLFLVLRYFPKDKKTIALFGFLTAAFVQSIIAIGQFIYQKSLACKYLGMAAHEASVLGTAVIESSSGRWLRAYGAMDHPNVLGGIMALACLWSAWYLISDEKKSFKLKIFFWLVYLSSLTALFFSFSRSAWLAFILAKIILLIFSYWQKMNWSRIILVFLASLFLLFPLVFIYQDLVSVRLLAQGRIENISLVERSQSLKTFSFSSRSEFLFGQGFGAHTVWQFKQDETKLAAWAYQPIHNTWLLLWSEIGLFGLLAFLVFLVAFIRNLLIKRKDFFLPGLLVCLVFLIIFNFDHWPFSLASGLWILFLSLGIIE